MRIVRATQRGSAAPSPESACRVIKRGFALVVLAALTGCGGGGGGGSGFIDPCPAAAAVPDRGATLTSPARGATGVSTTAGTVSFTVTDPSLRTGIFQLIAISPPSTTPVVYRPPITIGAGGVLSVAIPALQPRTTYTASASGFPSDPATGCFGLVTADLGTFTTQ
jgi:hypothetical protein